MNRSVRRLSLTLLVGPLFAAAACSNSPGEDEPDATAADVRDTRTVTDTMSPRDGVDTHRDVSEDAETGSADTTPPELRDIKVSIAGEFSSRVDLKKNSNVTRFLPVPADAEFTVFATDDETDPENLRVAAIDGDGDTLEKTDETFRNGLWRFTVEVKPGTTTSVRVTDGADNSVTSPASLVIPTREEALVANWERRSYDKNQNITERWNRTFSKDGSWSEQRPNRTLSGTYSVDGDKLKFTVESDSNGDAGRRTVSSFYVDDTYFDHLAWRRSSGSKKSLTGTWKRSFVVFERTNGSYQKTRAVTQTLEFESKKNGTRSWRRTTTGTDYSGTGTSSINRSASGTYKRIENTSYSGNYGDFLRRTTTHRDGSKLGTDETVTELYKMPVDKLLISPYLRSPSSG